MLEPYAKAKGRRKHSTPKRQTIHEYDNPLRMLRWLNLWFMRKIERIGWHHLFIDFVPSNHLAATPAFVCHIDGYNTCQAEFHGAIERFTIANVIV